MRYTRIEDVPPEEDLAIIERLMHLTEGKRLKITFEDGYTTTYKNMEELAWTCCLEVKDLIRFFKNVTDHLKFAAYPHDIVKIETYIPEVKVTTTNKYRNTTNLFN